MFSNIQARVLKYYCAVYWRCVLPPQSRTERDAKRMSELEMRIQTENSRNNILSDELSTLKVQTHFYLLLLRSCFHSVCCQ